jgi:hypothetical protein
MKTLTILLTMLIASCGGQEQSTANVKTYPCDSEIVAIMATMTSPFVMGLGAPDTTTYTTQGINHIMTYDFHALHERITFEYNTNYCSERVETGL